MKLFVYLYFEHPLGAPSDVGPHLTLVYSPAATGPVEVFIRAAGLAMLACPRGVLQTGKVERFGDDLVPVALIDDSESQLTRARVALLDHLAAHGAKAPSTHEAFRPHITLDESAIGDPLGVPREQLVAQGFGVRLVDEEDEVLADHRWPFDASPMAECPPPDPAVVRPAPAGHIVGRPMRIARVGQVHSRRGEGTKGRALTHQDLVDAARYFDQTGDAVPLDREHLESSPGGLALAMYLVDEGQALAILPAYNAERPSTCSKCAAGVCPNPLHEPLAEFVARQNGVCWPSPRILWGKATDAATGEVVGRCRIPNCAVTTKPATAHRAVDEARLAEETPMDSLIAALKADPRMPASLLEAAEELRAQFVDDPEGGVAALVKLLGDALEAAGPAEASEGESEGEAAMNEERRMDSGEQEEDRRSEDGTVQAELLAATAAAAEAAAAARAESSRLQTQSELLRAERQTIAEERFSAGVEAGKWAEGERALFMHLSAQSDGQGKKAFETTFLSRRPGHVQTDVRLSEAPTGRRSADNVFDRIEADRKDGESFNEALARWEADGRLGR